LFDFTHRTTYGLDFCWKGAIKNLDAEAAVVLAFVQQEGLQVPYFGHLNTISCSWIIFYNAAGQNSCDKKYVTVSH
jgi:hypothetical protein